MFPKSAFVLGGAPSGKSQWAEELVKSYDLPMTYLATGQVFDDEVAARVETHQKRRDDRWTTIEAPFDLTAPLANLSSQQVVLIDCATMWLSNQMMQETDLTHQQTALIQSLRTCKASWVIVSNEVGQGIVPENALARKFREAQGRLNIALAKEAELAVQVIAGLPQILKGEMP